MIRLWQATLFGELTSKALLYASNPSNAFEKFISFSRLINQQEKQEKTGRSGDKFMEN